jgi:hypothetical protein
MRKLTTTAVVIAIAVLGHALCRGQELTPEARWRWTEQQVTVTPPAAPPAVTLPILEATPNPSRMDYRDADGDGNGWWSYLDNSGEMTPDQVDAAMGIPADGQPTPRDSVEAGLAALHLQPGKTLVVYGSGLDARWEITAARQCPGLRVIGIEIDPAVAESARAAVVAAGLSDRVQILTGDATTMNVPAHYGAAYLWPNTLKALLPKIQKLERFVSYSHPVPGLGGIPRDGDVYVYARQHPQMQRQLVRPSSAVYGGRTYSGPVCNRPGCSMCAKIRAQLAPRYVTVPATTPQTVAAPRSGHWATVKVCRNGRCTMQRRWVED